LKLCRNPPRHHPPHPSSANRLLHPGHFSSFFVTTRPQLLHVDDVHFRHPA
jgi:hypothetical protein